MYDYRTGNADPTEIRTDGESTAFANPTVTAVRAPDGGPALVMTMFVPSQGAAPGEAGALLYCTTS